MTKSGGNILPIVALAFLAVLSWVPAVGKALPSFEKIYASNDKDELVAWGRRYARGVGVQQDPQKGVKLFCKAARKGDIDATFELGQIYAHGHGVKADRDLAAAWFYQAAQGGVRKAKIMLKIFKVTGKPKRPATCPLNGIDVNRSPDHDDSRPPELAGTGTGFVVSKRRTLITNQHVIEGCLSVAVRKPGEKSVEVTVVEENRNLDLAILKSASDLAEAASFRQGKSVRPGDSIVVYGFPLSGTLATTGNVTTGTVTALAGIGDDQSKLQISAPVQPGNSGGPVLDLSGNVVGIVSSRLNAAMTTAIFDYYPQNVNFAVKAETARTYIDAYGVDYVVAHGGIELKPADVAEVAKKFTYRVECYK